MSKNKNRSPFVYSTNPDFSYGDDSPQATTAAPAAQVLRIQLETKHRGGKTASVIKGFSGTDADLQQLARQLKAVCGTGGSAKEGEIIIQGDHRDKLLNWLLQKGYKQTRKSGG